MPRYEDDWGEPTIRHEGGEFLQWKFYAFLLAVILFLLLGGWIWWNFDKYYALAFMLGVGGLLAFYLGQRQALGIVRGTLHEFVDAQHATGQTAAGMFKVMGQMINFKKMLATEEKKRAAIETEYEVKEPEPWELPDNGPAGYLDTGSRNGSGPTYYN